MSNGDCSFEFASNSVQFILFSFYSLSTLVNYAQALGKRLKLEVS
jgi:hypothetical protein